MEFHTGHKHPDTAKKTRRQARAAEVQRTRREEAEARDAKWRKLTPQAQLAELDLRLGVGVGAERQRAAIAKLIAGEKK